MKVRNGFVSNSSSTAYIITNKTDQPLLLMEFVKENLDLIDLYNKEYSHSYSSGRTRKEVLESAEREDTTFLPGTNYVVFGDEDGTTIGAIYDYILRYGGESERFKWRYCESKR